MSKRRFRVKSSQYKSFSDPVHGFITLPKGVILNLIDHPYVPRLRRIRQLGLGYLVFPAAEHSRFSHAIGAMELGQRVLKNLREKNATISDAEVEGTLIAILLHDVGDRKSTRLNSSHVASSYAVFCLEK